MFDVPEADAGPEGGHLGPRAAAARVDLPPGWRPCQRCGLGIPSSHGTRCELCLWEALFEQPRACDECGRAVLTSESGRKAQNKRFCSEGCWLQSLYRRRRTSKAPATSSANLGLVKAQQRTPWRRRDAGLVTPTP